MIEVVPRKQNSLLTSVHRGCVDVVRSGPVQPSRAGGHEHKEEHTGSHIHVDSIHRRDQTIMEPVLRSETNSMTTPNPQIIGIQTLVSIADGRILSHPATPSSQSWNCALRLHCQWKSVEDDVEVDEGSEI